jgi:CSLREA domain-containing protein
MFVPPRRRGRIAHYPGRSRDGAIRVRDPFVMRVFDHEARFRRVTSAKARATRDGDDADANLGASLLEEYLLMSRLDAALSLFAAATVLTTTLAGCRDASVPTRLLTPRSPLRTEVATAPVVNSLADNGGGCSDTQCTLRDAIAFANPGATITFSVTGTIVLAHGELLINKDVTIDGGGAPQLQVDGAKSSREFEIAAGATVSLSGLTMQDGNVPDPTAPFGGGIRNFGTLTLTNTVVSGNGASGEGGGIHNSGGALTIVGSTISSNFGANGGGIMNAEGAVSITNSTVSGNFGGVGGGIQNSGSMTITNSTIAGNSVGSQGGRGSGIANTGLRTTLINTIVANDPAGGNCYGQITTDGGYNIEDGTTCGFTAATSHSNSNPGLDPAGLLSNGGPTPTIGLLTGALAVDLIPTGINECGTTITTDQRGVARPFGSGCDVGAYELDFKGFLPPINNVRTNPIHPGKGVPIQFILGGDHGLAIFASGSPSSAQIACPLSDASGDVLPTVTAGNSELSYDPSTDTYTYVWKTDKSWAGTCRRLFVTFADGSVRTADFSFDR